MNQRSMRSTGGVLSEAHDCMVGEVRYACRREYINVDEEVEDYAMEVKVQEYMLAIQAWATMYIRNYKLQVCKKCDEEEECEML